MLLEIRSFERWVDKTSADYTKKTTLIEKVLQPNGYSWWTLKTGGIPTKIVKVFGIDESAAASLYLNAKQASDEGIIQYAARLHNLADCVHWEITEEHLRV